jgi:hypothetical protein
VKSRAGKSRWRERAEIFINKCAEYSPTNETIGAAFSLLRGNAVGRKRNPPTSFDW